MSPERTLREWRKILFKQRSNKVKIFLGKLRSHKGWLFIKIISLLIWCEIGKITLTILVVLRDLLYREGSSQSKSYTLALKLPSNGTGKRWCMWPTSSVKIKITEQKDTLKIKTFNFSACCHFKHKQYLYYSDRERKQGKRGEEIPFQVCNGGNGDAYNMANSRGTSEVRCFWEMEPKIRWKGVYMLGR